MYHVLDCGLAYSQIIYYIVIAGIKSEKPSLILRSELLIKFWSLFVDNRKSQCLVCLNSL